MKEAHYTAENTDVAYQLNWSYSLFWKESPSTRDWVGELPKVMEQDSIRDSEESCPSHSGETTLSGALDRPNERRLRPTWRRSCVIIDSPMNDSWQSWRSIKSSTTLDLSAPRETAHARYWYNLHLVFVMRDREWHTDEEFFAKLQAMVIGAAGKKGHRLSRASILPDHVHLALGCELADSPAVVALSYMNNLAHAVGMAAFEHRYWVGTFGEYDLGAVSPSGR